MLSKKKRSVALAASAVLAAAGATFVGSDAAFAADCPANVLCLYQNTSWGGDVMIITSSTTNIGSWFNDKTTAFSNHTGYKWCLFDNAGYGGDKLVVIQPYTASANVGSFANDRTTSLTYHSVWC